MATKDVIGGLGFGLNAERGIWALGAEAQILPVVACDTACGGAYEGGLSVSLMPGSWRGLTARFGLALQYYGQPGLHQYVPAVGPRIGLRWLQHEFAGISLDAGVSFVAASDLDPNGFARNKIIGWGIPELILGIWF